MKASTAVLMVFIVTAMLGHGCGASHLSRPAFCAPAVSVHEVEAVTLHYASGLLPNGIMAPVGVRGDGSNYIIVDVFVAYPDPPRIANEDPLNWFAFVAFNRMQITESVMGHGFVISSKSDADDYHAVQVRFDTADIHSDIKYKLGNRLEASTSKMHIGSIDFITTIVPIVVACDHPVAPDSRIEVQLNSTYEFYPPQSKTSLITRVRAFPQ